MEILNPMIGKLEMIISDLESLEELDHLENVGNFPKLDQPTLEKRLSRLLKKYKGLTNATPVSLHDFGLLMKESGFQENQALLYITRALKYTNITNINDQLIVIREVYRLNAYRSKIRLTGRTLQGKHTLIEWENKLKEFHYSCAYCGKSNAKLTKDHVIPVSKGGVNTIDNIVPACWPCNYSKRALPVDLFEKKKGEG